MGPQLAALRAVSTTLRKVTVRGVGSSSPVDDELFDIDNAFSDDAFEAGPLSGSRPRVSCPPPSGSSTRYSIVATRQRDTLSMLAVPFRDEDVSRTA